MDVILQMDENRDTEIQDAQHASNPFAHETMNADEMMDENRGREWQQLSLIGILEVVIQLARLKNSLWRERCENNR